MHLLGKPLFSALSYLSVSDRQQVERAMEKAILWHDGQTRESGDPYVTHPIAVATYLAMLEAERDTIIAALLHDVVEDERATPDQIASEFGTEVLKLVEAVTKLTKMQYEGRRHDRQVASLRKLLLTASEDLRVIIIKLADRWHNAQTLASLGPDKKERIARETLEIYAPFARIVGLWDLKRGFEEVCFPIVYPKESAEWHQKIAAIRDRLLPERQKFVDRLNAETRGEVVARLTPMTDFELYQKFFGDISHLEETQHVDSVLAVIMGSEKEADCYEILGEIHSRYPARALSFRDYINVPTPNGYRALHTTIFLSRKHELRLRIQTERMYNFVSRRKFSSWSAEQDNIRAALASLNRPSYDREQYIGDLKTEVFDRINVFTVAGEIVTLPKGASGIDFAFTLSPDSASKLAGIRVNGELRDASFEVQDGDTVEMVLLEKGELQKTRLQWLEKVKSVEAREALKDNLRRQPQDSQKDEGRNLMILEAKKRKLPLWSMEKWSGLQRKVLQILKIDNYDALLRDLGSGEIAVSKVMDAYESVLAEPPSILQRILRLFGLLPDARILNKSASLIDIDVYAEDRQGLIFDITRCIAERKINISRFRVYAIPPKDALYAVRLEIPDFQEFSKLYDSILQVPSVKTIIRRR